MGKLLHMPTERSESLAALTDHDFVVRITVGQLRQLIREESVGHRGSPVSDSPPGSSSEPYLTVAEAANLARIAESTVRARIRNGDLRAQRVGRRVIIARTELDRFLRSQ